MGWYHWTIGCWWHFFPITIWPIAYTMETSRVWRCIRCLQSSLRIRRACALVLAVSKVSMRVSAADQYILNDTSNGVHRSLAWNRPAFWTHPSLNGGHFASGVRWCWRRCTSAFGCRASACPMTTASLIGDGRRAFVQFSPGVSLLLGVRVDECNHVRFGHRVGNDIGYG